MNYRDFHDGVTSARHPVILLEGTRQLPAGRKYREVVRFAAWLAQRYPLALFRTGNARGADAAFAAGVRQVDPTRLQYVLPYAGHRAGEIAGESYQFSGDDLDSEFRDAVLGYTLAASPKQASMLSREGEALPPKVRAQGKYLLRDTLKVVGNRELGPATAGLFFVNEKEPMKGGTGHTVRVCQARNVPVAFQQEWLSWPSLVGR